ncbi:carboxyl-terminal protease [Desulfurobacterium thermolithotrophum DSM 11699]|uniref:Carboxyl-terminal protease n=1 Tax=Desulfurobacterium thermolithotrophum (strain DSM 11699 / BSA) TaxID=868864 RepID=F0S2C5_DESTD|nr:S41 family peptidase [Desulfurobacterium thermolithotrophum]ADY74140.1 carboxyl-terminal protease [Desulfurobacterium thermolithotrophum DSM 11699]
MKKAFKSVLFFSLLITFIFSLGKVSLSAVSEGKATEEKEVKYIRLFTEVYQLVKDRYVEPVTPKKLFEGAIQGMLGKLDPHSTLFTPDKLKEFEVETQGEFGGLGIQITKTKDGKLMIIAPIEDTPAYKAGIKAGDVIVKIEKKEVTPDMTLMEAVKLMRGKPGTKITIWIWRKGWSEPKPFTITRAIIKIQSVKYRMLKGDIGYIRFTMFQKNSVEEFKKALQELVKDKKLKGVIVDVRNNPGGLLDSAVSISDYFLPKGALIVYTKGRIPDSIKRFYSTNDPILPLGIPVVMLVNGGTASAAEILTGALRYNDRAIVVGEKTFGKGSVQTLYPLEMGYAVKITTAKYYMPNNECIDGKGIEPDIEVKLSKEDIEQLKEDAKEIEEHPEKTEEIRKEREKRIDNQLRRAIEVIKEFYLFQQMKQRKPDQKKAA